jgi:hypothetical protein
MLYNEWNVYMQLTEATVSFYICVKSFNTNSKCKTGAEKSLKQLQHG